MLWSTVGLAVSLYTLVSFWSAGAIAHECQLILVKPKNGYVENLRDRLEGNEKLPLPVRSHRGSDVLHTNEIPEAYLENRQGEPWLVVRHPGGAEVAAPLEVSVRNLGLLSGREGKDRVDSDRGSFFRTALPLSTLRDLTAGLEAPIPRKFVSQYFLSRLAKLSSESGAVFLDFACGGGTFVKDLLKKGVEIRGLDIMLGPHLMDPSIFASQYFVCADGRATGLRDETFSGIFSFYGPLWVNNVDFSVAVDVEMLRELYRIMQPGAFLIVGPANYFRIRDALEIFPEFRIYESSKFTEAYETENESGEIEFRTRLAFSVPWLSVFDYVVLERPTLDGSPTVLDRVLGPRQFDKEDDPVRPLEDEGEYLRYLEQIR